MKRTVFTSPVIFALAVNAQKPYPLPPFTNDAETRISTNKIYTHALNFGALSGMI